MFINRSLFPCRRIVAVHNKPCLSLKEKPFITIDNYFLYYSYLSLIILDNIINIYVIIFMVVNIIDAFTIVLCFLFIVILIEITSSLVEENINFICLNSSINLFILLRVLLQPFCGFSHCVSFVLQRDIRVIRTNCVSAFVDLSFCSSIVRHFRDMMLIKLNNNVRNPHVCFFCSPLSLFCLKV